MSSKILFQKENNLFQSLNWLAFQENYGRKTEHLGEWAGIQIDLPLGQDFLWVEKGPERVDASFITEAKKSDVTFVRIEPAVLSDAEVKKFNLKPVDKTSLLSGQASPKCTRVLDLTKTEEELLAEMKSKTRYNIRLAEKKDVVVKRLDNEDILFEMLTATSEKNTGFFPHEKNYYTKLIKDLGKNDVAHIYVAEHEGDFLAAILVTFYGKVATYLHGGQSDKKKNLMAPYLCQWTAIKEARDRGCAVYDFWGVAESDDPTDAWAGISRFKEGFGGEKIVFPGSFDLVLKPFWYNCFTLLAKLRKIFK